MRTVRSGAHVANRRPSGLGRIEFVNSQVSGLVLSGWDLGASAFFRVRHKGFKRVYSAVLARQLAS